MGKKHLTLIVCIVFSINLAHPAPAHANFFLFNIINDILGIGKRDKPPEEKPKSQPTALRFGMKDTRVASMQQALIKARYLAGGADGVFGYKTLQAVRDFQHDAGLEPDGIFGIRTENALNTFKGVRQQKKATSKKPSLPKKDTGIPSYLYTIPMVATAYTRYDDGCTDYTYRGTYLRRGLVAVDPAVIPLGTKLYVPGYGEALADDIGGAIQGNRIDLAMETLPEAFEWGVQRITVYVLPNQ